MFTIEFWKEKLVLQIDGWRWRIRGAGVGSVYAFLSAIALSPMVESYKQGDIGALMVLGSILAKLEDNVIASQMKNWGDESDTARKLSRCISENPALRDELDTVLEKLEVPKLAQVSLSLDDRKKFVVAFQQELARLHSTLKVEVFIEDDSILADAVETETASAVISDNTNIVAKEPENNVQTGDIRDISGGEINLAGKDIIHLQGQTVVLAKNGGTVHLDKLFPVEETRQEQTRHRYLERLCRSCKILPLVAMRGEDTVDEEITLDQVYIDLDTVTQVPLNKNRLKGLVSELPDAHITATLPLSVLEAAQQARYLVLLGEPGSGKSTFLHKLIAWLASSMLGLEPSPPGFSADLMPVLVLARELAQRLVSLNLGDFSAAKQKKILAQAVRDHILEDLVQYDVIDFKDTLLQVIQDGKWLLALDGLDEVPQASREYVRQAVGAVIQIYQPQRVIVTCRTRSYTGKVTLPNFSVCVLAPWDERKIRRFIQAWYASRKETGRVRAHQEKSHTMDLISVALAPGMRDLASNPMMLTTMAIIHQQEMGLPDKRAKLYDLALDVLARRWQKFKTEDRELSISEKLMAFLRDDLRWRRTLERLAYEAHRRGLSDKNVTSLDRGQVLTLLETSKYFGDIGLAAEFLDYVDQRAGLLVGRGGELGKPTIYGFPHRVFQEYMAGCYILSQRDLARMLYTHARDGDYWDLAVQLGFEDLYYNCRGINTLLDLAYQLCPFDIPEDVQGQRALLWSSQIAALVGRDLIINDHDSSHGGAAYLSLLLRHLVQVLTSQQLPPLNQAEIGYILAVLGDPRLEVVTLEHMQFCWIPPGEFLFSRHHQKHAVHLSGYWISRYPITQAQFSEFVKAGGYENKEYWREARDAGVWKNGCVIRRHFEYDNNTFRIVSKKSIGPHVFGGVFDLPNYPVVGISWYEALAFARWLTNCWQESGYLAPGMLVTLPSEAEWKKAARGGIQIPGSAVLHSAKDGLPASVPQVALCPNEEPSRNFPWGSVFQPDRSNSAESGIRTTSAVGCFPSGASPYNVLDLCGNTWEWTRSLWGDNSKASDFGDIYNAKDGRENLAAPQRVLRIMLGGSFDLPSLDHTYCGRYEPDHWLDNCGFRLVVFHPANKDGV